MRSRAYRRNQKERMKRRARFVARLIDVDKEQWVLNADHLSVCSCWMCGNPRKWLGERTRQETMAELDLGALENDTHV